METRLYVFTAVLSVCLPGLARGEVNWMTGGDILDIDQGTTIGDTSPIAVGSNPEALLSVEEPGVEFGTVIFPDGADAGTVHFIEWETAEAVTLAGFNLWANGDTPSFPEGRTIHHFKLIATVGENDVVVYDEDVASPYTFLDDDNFPLIISTPVPVTTASHWRAEFTQHSDSFNSGPRIQELDGYAPKLCGDGNHSGNVTASDALLALKAAVGAASCIYCACNVVGDEDITATDSLAILRSAVGVEVELDCIACYLGEDSPT
ncbi:MAG TPA: hypothetical protein VEL28_16480 [Candidatus Binatia bacterium]|nr:hypothetical protein [Candidatus Binatia bacterium]